MQQSPNNHPRVSSGEDICLLPDIPPRSLAKQEIINRIVHNALGCDGMGQVLAIITKEGMAEDIIMYNVAGKTNHQIIRKAFESLAPWAPAKHKGKTVVAQIRCTIYV